jgi:hypothetical protein
VLQPTSLYWYEVVHIYANTPHVAQQPIAQCLHTNVAESPANGMYYTGNGMYYTGNGTGFTTNGILY